MGLLNDIDIDVIEAFGDDLLDARVDFILNVPSKTYDPETGMSEFVLDYSGWGWREDYSESDALGSRTGKIYKGIEPTDIIISCLQSQLDATPQVNNEIVLDDTCYRIHWINKDPVNATWTLLLRLGQ